MNFLSRDFLYHRGIFKTTYRGPGIGLTSGVSGLCAEGFSRTSHGKEFRIGVHCTSPDPKQITRPRAVLRGTL